MCFNRIRNEIYLSIISAIVGGMLSYIIQDSDLDIAISISKSPETNIEKCSNLTRNSMNFSLAEL